MQSASDETTRQLTPLVPLTPVVAAAAREDVPRLTNDVFGYLPYWEMNSKTERYLRYDLLTTIAFFGVPINPNGGLGRSSPGYKAYLSPRATRIIQRAHAGGVRTEITFTSFGTRRNAQLFGSGPHRRQFVKQAMALMRARGADGANLDIELISSRYYAAFGALVRWLKEAAVAQNPDAQISVATNANVSGARMAAIALANGADRVFMMGYDYKWSGSERVGAVDPLVSATHGLSLSRSVNIYNRYHVPLDKVILGLGYYGRSWPTASKRLHARVRMNAARYGSSQVFFPRSLSRAKKGATLTHDRYEQAARLLKFDKSRRTWVQTYFNDPAAISAKLQLTHERDLAGMGIWALGYDRGLPGYWDAIKNAYGAPPAVAPVQVPDPNLGLIRRWF